MRTLFDIIEQKHDTLRHARDCDNVIDAEIKRLKLVLSPKERRILKWRNVDSLTLEEVGRKLGVNRERVRQLEAKAKERVRLYYETPPEGEA
jgi:RNA polymerase primary sigma factor